MDEKEDAYPLMPYVMQCLQQLAANPDQVNPDSVPMKLYDNFFKDGGRWVIQSVASRANALGVPAKNVWPWVRIMANMLQHCDVLVRRSLENSLLSTGQVFCYVDFWRGDETPMPIGFQSFLPWFTLQSF